MGCRSGCSGHSMPLEALTAADFMTTPVHAVGPDDLVTRIVTLLCQHRISGIPVVSAKGLLLGLVSERDVLDAMLPGAAGLNGKQTARGKGFQDIRRLRARDLMVRKLITATPETEPLRLASLMAIRKIRRIPIVEGKKLVGIVSHGDVYRAIFKSQPAVGSTQTKPG